MPWYNHTIMRRNKLLSVVSICALALILLQGVSYAYWVWTPDSKKFVNPKYAPKDSPKEQYDWAMSFYEAKDFPRAAAEFEKLTKHYEYSEYASKAQYYAGMSYENMGKYYIAFQAFQKGIENFPHSENIDEIIARQFNIGNLYLTKDATKVMGTDIMSSADRSVEIFQKVIDNAPYGNLADQAQFKLGEAYKKIESYEEAMQAFQKVVDNYPDSGLVERARYEMAYCAYMASLKPAYASEPTDRAIKAFEEFADANKDELLTKEAEKTIQRLKDKSAEKSFSTAEFYEKQKKYTAAVVYYRDVIERYPDSSFASLAKIKIENLEKRIKK